jgi:hypothetical protein
VDSIKRAAVLADLTQRLEQQGSWCGETHIQKATYLAQALAGIPTGFEFILYKHGPFSFDLSDELDVLQAQEILASVPQRMPYGPRIRTTEVGRKLRDCFPRMVGELDGRLALVAGVVRDRGATDLERLATALLVSLEPAAGRSVGAKAARLRELNPHVGEAEARAAVEEIETLQGRAAGMAEVGA